MKLLVFSLIPAFILPNLNAKERTDGREKPVVYNHTLKDGDPGDQMVRARYGKKYRIVEFRNDPTYIPSKNTKRIAPTPQRDAAGNLLTGSVRLCLIVTTEGRVLEPFVERSTNRKLDPVVLEVIKQWRGTPARLNGQPISIALYQDFTFR